MSMNDEAKYTIDDVEYVQTYLTISETIKLTKMFSDLNFSEVELSVIPVLEVLQESGKIEQFFRLVLRGENPVNLDKIKPVVAVEIVQDFLSFNEVSKIFSMFVSTMRALNEDPSLKAFLVQKKPNAKTKA